MQRQWQHSGSSWGQLVPFSYEFVRAHTNSTAAPSRSGSLKRCYEAHMYIIVTTLIYKLIQQTTSVDFGAGGVGLGC